MFLRDRILFHFEEDWTGFLVVHVGVFLLFFFLNVIFLAMDSQIWKGEPLPLIDFPQIKHKKLIIDDNASYPGLDIGLEMLQMVQMLPQLVLL